MVYYQLFYHLVWATKNREPRITESLEAILYNLLRTKAIGLEGSVFAINGVEDHVHMVVSIPPKVAVAAFIGQIKGIASAKLNQHYPSLTPFYWQDDYGAFSFDGKRLTNVIAYVENQKHHHAQRNTIPLLERTEGEDAARRFKENSAGYLVEDIVWRQEMLLLSAE